MTTGFEAYCQYVALKNHFNKPEYDYIKYNGKVRVNLDSYKKRKDKIFYEKLAKHPDVFGFLIANFVVNKNVWIRELSYSEESERIYKDWVKRQQSLTYNFQQELMQFGDFNEMFLVKNNSHPDLFKSYLSNEVSFETLCILLEVSKAKKYWDKKMEYDPVWQEYSMKVTKYTPFIHYNKDAIKQIIFNQWPCAA